MRYSRGINETSGADESFRVIAACLDAYESFFALFAGTSPTKFPIGGKLHNLNELDFHHGYVNRIWRSSVDQASELAKTDDRQVFLEQLFQYRQRQWQERSEKAAAVGIPFVEDEPEYEDLDFDMRGAANVQPPFTDRLQLEKGRGLACPNAFDFQTAVKLGRFDELNPIAEVQFYGLDFPAGRYFPPLFRADEPLLGFKLPCPPLSQVSFDAKAAFSMLYMHNNFERIHPSAVTRKGKLGAYRLKLGQYHGKGERRIQYELGRMTGSECKDENNLHQDIYDMGLRVARNDPSISMERLTGAVESRAFYDVQNSRYGRPDKTVVYCNLPWDQYHAKHPDAYVNQRKKKKRGNDAAAQDPSDSDSDSDSDSEDDEPARHVFRGARGPDDMDVDDPDPHNAKWAVDPRTQQPIWYQYRQLLGCNHRGVSTQDGWQYMISTWRLRKDDKVECVGLQGRGLSPERYLNPDLSPEVQAAAKKRHTDELLQFAEEHNWMRWVTIMLREQNGHLFLPDLFKCPAIDGEPAIEVVEYELGQVLPVPKPSRSFYATAGRVPEDRDRAEDEFTQRKEETRVSFRFEQHATRPDHRCFVGIDARESTGTL